MMTFINAIRSWLADHKKITAAFLGLVASIVPDTLLSSDQKTHIIEVLLVYLGAQGVADHGKAKAQIEAATTLKLANK